MKLLMIHADKLEYWVKKRAVKEAEEPEKDHLLIEDCLVVYTAVEKGDDENLVKNALEEIKNVSERVNAERIVIYPWVHLTSEPASFKKAEKLIDLLTTECKSHGFDVHRVPGGWYKAFEIRCKGHPLAETLREVKPGKPAKVEGEEKPGKFLILMPDGTELEPTVETLDKIGEDFKTFVMDELGISHQSGDRPPHIELMRRLELVDYEPASDVGHFRFYPKGALVKGLIEDLSVELANRIKAMRIETPFMYRLEVDAIREQAEKFRERNYVVPMDGRQLIVRFAGDFGLFEMLKDATISYRNLPARFFELSPSFRLEQRGECVGLRRLRAFTMPDIHCLTMDMKQALEEYKMLFKLFAEVLRDLEVDFIVAFRVVEEYYHKLKPEILEMLSVIDKPALIEILPEMKHYWAMKHEFQFVDSVGGHAQLSTVQLDVEDSERYGITFVDKDGMEKGTLIIHSSIGSIERYIYCLLEEGAKKSKSGVKPMLPVWISPVQVRVIPVSMEQLKYAEKQAEKLNNLGVRTELDDRDLRLSRKIADAEKMWIPYIAVVGREEAGNGTLMVRIRKTGEKRRFKAEELALAIKEETRGKPWRPLPMPMKLTEQPHFTRPA